MILFVSTLLVLFLFLSADYIAMKVFSKNSLGIQIKIISFFLVPYSLLCLNAEYFRGYKKTFYFSVFRQTTITTLSFFILLLFKSSGDLVPLLSYCFSILILYILSCFFVYNIFNSKKELIEPKKYKDILKISIPMMLTSSMFYILQWSDTLILGMYNSSNDVGIYNIVLKISLFAGLGLFAVNSIVAPLFAKYFYNGNDEEFINSVKQSSKLIFWSSVPILIFIILNANWILLFFGEEYLFGKIPLMILIIGQFASSMSGSVGYILQMTGKQNIFQKIILFSTCINIILNFILIPKFGIIGASFSSMLSIVLWNFLSILYIYKKYNVLTIYIPYYSKKILNKI